MNLGSSVSKPLSSALIRALAGNGGGEPPEIPIPLQVPYTQGVWHDASDASTISLATGVSQWNDKFANGLHLTQATGALQPAYGARTHNGLNVVDFVSASAHRMAWPSGLLNIANGPNPVFIVHVLDNVSGGKRLLQGENNFGSHRWGERIANSSGTVINGTTNVNIGGFTASNLAISGFRRNGTNLEPFRDGTKGTANPTAASDMSIFNCYLGATNAGTDPYDGFFAEILIWRDELSDTWMNTVGNYLKTKWNGTWAGF